MSVTLEIPDSHWRDSDHKATFRPHWEKSLRSNVEAEPDPSKRFEVWLRAKASGESTGGVRLIFIEQPYLDWAELIEAAIEKAESDQREASAYLITHPHDD